jgi:hypothetical protein
VAAAVGGRSSIVRRMPATGVVVNFSGNFFHSVENYYKQLYSL